MTTTAYRTHRDYSDADLQRALVAAYKRMTATAEGSDDYFTASAIHSTLAGEATRRNGLACQHGWSGPWNSRPCGCGLRTHSVQGA